MGGTAARMTSPMARPKMCNRSNRSRAKMPAGGWTWITRRSASAFLAVVLLLASSAGQFVVAQSATVRLVIDYGDGVIKTITDVAWTKGNTVFDVMTAARRHTHGIEFKNTGSGSSAFLTQIDDVPNQGGGAGKKNWQFWVNTTYGDKSFGVYEVQALDVVFWRFTSPEGK
jgi:hypothetical protein